MQMVRSRNGEKKKEMYTLPLCTSQKDRKLPAEDMDLEPGGSRFISQPRDILKPSYI
jgi:hypothetical protein